MNLTNPTRKNMNMRYQKEKRDRKKNLRVTIRRIFKERQRELFISNTNIEVNETRAR
jgi:hypothetical protein